MRMGQYSFGSRKKKVRRCSSLQFAGYISAASLILLLIMIDGRCCRPVLLLLVLSLVELHPFSSSAAGV